MVQQLMPEVVFLVIFGVFTDIFFLFIIEEIEEFFFFFNSSVAREVSETLIV